MSISYTADQLQKKFQGAPGASGFARIAETLREEGRHEEAVALCQEGLRQKPGSLTGLLVLGKCFLDMDRLEEAREQLEGALRQDPRCLSAMHLLARIMTKQQWGEAAAAYYRSILELEPWDSESQARFRELSPSGAAGWASAAAVPAGSASAAHPAVPPIQTLEALEAAAPSGPEVEEFDLNDVAAFPSDESSPGDLAGALEEVSLEDALGAPTGESRVFAPPPPMPDLGEPRPLDILTETAPAAAGEGEPVPISGDDVGDRLDSLFGAEDDQPLVAPTAPSAEAPDAEPGRPDADFADATLQLKALRDQQLPQGDAGGAATTFSGPAADFAWEEPEAASPAPAETAAPGSDEDAARPDADFRAEPALPTETPAFSGGELLPPEERVSGEDIEARLDDLFSLHDTSMQPVMKAFPDEALAGESAPPAPEAAATWSGASPAEAALEEAPAAEAPAAEAAGILDLEGALPAVEDAFLAPGIADPDPVLSEGEGEVVTGQDVADKLEALFGEEPPRAEASSRDAAASGLLASGSASWAAARPAADEADAADGLQAPDSSLTPASDLMTTESMLPRGPGMDERPPITGEDIEARLDSLFDLADEGSRSGAMPRVEVPVEAPPGADPRPVDFDPLDADFPTPAREPDFALPPMEVTSEEPQVEASAGPLQEEVLGDADRTLMMPAAKESPSDWLARQAEEPGGPGAGQAAPREPKAVPPGAGDTMFMRNEDVFADAPPASLGPRADDATGLEMVDGADIAERLDQIFASEVPDARGEDAPAAAARAAAEAAIARGEASADGMPAFAEPEAALAAEDPVLPAIEPEGLETGEMPLDEVALFAQDPGAALPMADGGFPEAPGASGETVISGEDIKARLSEIFDVPAEEAIRPMPMEDEESETPLFLANPGFAPEAEADQAAEATGDDLQSPALGARTPAADTGTRAPETGNAAATSLAPLMDEEEGSPEEEENAPQSAAGANVATVTLAEIYFQQGLREQALQIYRQLLEREPGNDSVRKRIQEIEASKPEAGTVPGSDPRRPRPGLKVPKRKK